MKDADWSNGWARTKPDGTQERWGSYLILEGRGRLVRLYRGPHNRCRFYDAQGEQVGPEQANVAPAIAAAHAAGWVSLCVTDPPGTKGGSMKCAVCGAPADGNFSAYGNPRKLEFLDGKCLDWANSMMGYPLLKRWPWPVWPSQENG